MRSGSKGFTLIEVLVAVLILGVGIAGVLGGFSSIASSESYAREVEKMNRLANEKLDELRATTDVFATNESGNFDEKGEPGYEWELQVDPSGIEFLEAVTVTVRRSTGSETPQVSASVLVFQPPAAEEVPEP